MAHGLMFACSLDGAGGARDIDLDEFVAQSGAATAWAHLDWQDAAARDWMSQQTWLNPSVRESLLEEDTRPRVVEYEDGLLINLRGVNMNEGADAEDMISIRVWLDAHRILSTRRRRMLTPREIYESFKVGKGPLNCGDFLQRLVGRLNEHIGPVVDQLEEDIDAAEERYVESVQGYRGEFGALRRRTARIRRYLAPQRDVLERISRLNSPVIGDADRMHIREAADEVTRLLEDLDLARERAMVAQEELTNRLTQQQNDRIYVLSLVAAVFLPLSFLTGVFGMNVAGLPGLENPAAFLLVAGVMAGLAVFILLLFRWRKWL